jgi:hypothetical protein
MDRGGYGQSPGRTPVFNPQPLSPDRFNMRHIPRYEPNPVTRFLQQSAEKASHGAGAKDRDLHLSSPPPRKKSQFFPKICTDSTKGL